MAQSGVHFECPMLTMTSIISCGEPERLQAVCVSSDARDDAIAAQLPLS